MTQETAKSEFESSHPFSLRDLATIAFRHRKIMALAFAGIMIGTMIAVVLIPKAYDSEMKILVKAERVDPIITPESNVPSQAPEKVSEEAIQSEVELLKSDDLLRDVVLKTGLDTRSHSLLTAAFHRGSSAHDIAVANAVRGLAKSLKIEPVDKSNIIVVRYSSSDPRQAANVLNTLASLYIDKHLQVHRAPGQYDFFNRQVQEYRAKLIDAESKIASSGTVAPKLMRDITVQKYNDFAANLAQTKAGILEAEQRIRALEAEQGDTPVRMTTQVKRSDNGQLLQTLKGTLLNLELKRSQLLTTYQPTYRPVQEVEKQIRETQAAIQHEESAPLREEITDQNPTHEWIKSELAKAKAELVALKARSSATERIVSQYNTSAENLEQKGLEAQDLERAAKSDEENYLLYVRKREEARISEALDRNRILNVAIAEAATVPVLPSRSGLQVLFVGFLLALSTSVGTAFGAEYLDQSFRTPDEVTATLNAPVLAAIPRTENPKGDSAIRNRWGGADIRSAAAGGGSSAIPGGNESQIEPTGT